MSLKETLHTEYYNPIFKKCKNCSRSVYTIEDGKVLYQCNIFGKFTKDCIIETEKRYLPKPEEILRSK